MNRMWTIAAILLFVAATVWLPAAHRIGQAGDSEIAHCPSCAGTAHHAPDPQQGQAPHDEGDGHASDACPICKLAQTPLEVAPLFSTLATPAITAIRAEPPSQSTVLRDALQLPFARAPPVRSGS